MMLSKALIKREKDVLVCRSKVRVFRAMQSASLSLGATLSWQESITHVYDVQDEACLKILRTAS